MKIFLIGMMGVGKSYWSQLLAKKLNYAAYDLDHVIVESAGMSIADMFASKGENYFRDLETFTLRDFGDKDNLILATGGGTPCFNENMDWMNKNGVTIWIDESVDILVERLTPEKAHRPLLSKLSDEELYKFLSLKLEERFPFYSQAQYRIGPYLEEFHFDFLMH
ncbi:MAG: shikimate kinase [Pseudopedobacter saltans]|uniref:Shikimate kinase n=1 Tax=Pseudopedobacter saltans TaxID=151895 RepID=A0A2W5EYL3_9SPHI|nr:MAG: shikimate kinase [Pseudopedobacter saltans]